MNETILKLPRDAETAVSKLRSYVEAEEFRGYDPYDGLNSPPLRWLSRRSKYARIAIIQLMKRLPFNARGLFLVPKDYNPKGLGLFLWGYAKLFRVTGDPVYREICKQLVGRLRELRSGGWSGAAWGYNFDWQSRAFFVPKGTPTIVNSSFIGHALLDASEFCGLSSAADLASSIRPFLLRDLHRTHCGETFCFSYTPHDTTAIHNANLLGASLLIRLDQCEPCAETKIAALRALRYTLDRQHVDGSWWYADTPYQQWIDSFHTGFNLQAIEYFLTAGITELCQAPFRRGVQFYTDHFFLRDGTAKYFHDRTFPIDVHSYSQAIVLLSRLGGHDALLERIVKKFLATFQDERGFFYFQQNKRLMNRIPYMRWNQAWAFHALTEYLLGVGGRQRSPRVLCCSGGT